MSITDDELGSGSIVRTSMGGLYVKEPQGTWWKLRQVSGGIPVPFKDLGSHVEVLYQSEVSVLNRFPVGSVIVFDGSGIAVHAREGFWTLPGLESELTFAEMESRIEDKSTIKRMMEES